MKPEKIWLNSLTAQIDFYLRGSDRSRKDANFNWEWFKRLPTARLIDTRRQIKRLLEVLAVHGPRAIQKNGCKKILKNSG